MRPYPMYRNLVLSDEITSESVRSIINKIMDINYDDDLKTNDYCDIPEGSLDCIYLNFSTPLPKLGYATQRLTHRNFLEVYKKLLKKGGRILQKTDDREFFDFSLEEYRACGFALENVTYNLHENGNPEWNIVTEYEQKWVEHGLPIHRVEAVNI